MKVTKHFLSITDLSAKEIWDLLFMAKKVKNQLKTKGRNQQLLKDKQMVMLFEKPSLRTKLSFDLGFNQLGGHSVYFSPEEVGLGKRETIFDVSKVVSSMADLIIARVFKHEDLVELAENSQVPVINALSDLEHPCQILADLLTIWETKGKLKGLNLAFIGDGANNVTHSLLLACAYLGINFRCASPKAYVMDKEIVKRAKIIAGLTNTQILETEDAKKAVKDADIIYADTWVSMGNEKEQNKRIKTFKPYQVNQRLMNLAKADAIFMHDMPAHRDFEVAKEVIDGPQSVIFAQAENRLHAQKALLIHFLT